MQDVQVDLELSEHCIETSAKRAHKERVARLVEADDMPEPEQERLAAEMELLEQFLKSWDFRALRTEEPDLAGGKPVWVRIHWNEDGRAVWTRIEKPNDESA